MKYAVLGSGRQGVASGYDLGKFGNAQSVMMWDMDETTAINAAKRLNKLLHTDIFSGEKLDVSNQNLLITKLKNIDAVICAVPYKFNLLVTIAAIASKTHMVDLGGHTATVRKQLRLSKKAEEAGISIIPDCGMGPGMNVTLALLAMEQMDQPEHVRIWDGGLPENPEPPWNYNLFFHINGLTNEYFGEAFFLQNGKVKEVPCFTGRETVSFPEPLGELEAAVTSGGLSTMPWTYAGKLQTLENKTLRYPGHWEWMIAYQQLGLFEEKPIRFKSGTFAPRDFYHHLLEPQLDRGFVPDVCLMRVECTGTSNGKPVTARIDAEEHYDAETGFLAMEKWTGWHASIFLILAAEETIPNGAVSVEKALSGSDFLKEAGKRGYQISASLD